MITVVDQITYLPKSSKDLKSQAYNVAAKKAVDLVKKKLAQIDMGGKSASVIISGKVSKFGSSLEMNMQITHCDDDVLVQKIQQVLGISHV